MNLKLIFLFFLSFLFLCGGEIFASPPDFIISEIMYHPESGSDREWVEVFYDGDTSETIQGGSSSKALKFFDGSGGSGNHNLVSPAYQGSLTIEPKTYFVLAHDGTLFKSLYPDFSGTIIEVSISLGDTKETIGFKEGSSGALFSSVTYEKSWGANGNGKSLEKKDLNGPNDSTNWIESNQRGGTPGQAYKEPEPANYPQTVKINEFLPNPKEGSEWVELYNSSAAEAAQLSDWQIDDKEGGSSPKTFSANIGPLGYFVFYFSADPAKSSSILNNSGDTVRLIQPDGKAVDSIDYSKSTTGFSWALINASWVETSQPTPGTINILAGDPEIFAGSIGEIKTLPLGHKVSLEAYVSAPPGLLGDKELYVWNKSQGIKIAYSQTPDPKFSVGDRVRVSSTLEESYGEKYIKTDSVTLIGSSAVNVEPVNILTGEATENYEGSLVRVEGALEEQSGNTFYLNDGSGQVKIYIKDSTGVIKPKLSLGDRVEVLGLVSQYGLLKNGDRNYRILPRFQSDVFNLTAAQALKGEVLGLAAVKELPRTGAAEDLYTWGWIFIFIGLSIKIRIYGSKS